MLLRLLLLLSSHIRLHHHSETTIRRIWVLIGVLRVVLRPGMHLLGRHLRLLTLLALLLTRSLGGGRRLRAAAVSAVAIRRVGSSLAVAATVLTVASVSAAAAVLASATVGVGAVAVAWAAVATLIAATITTTSLLATFGA